MADELWIAPPRGRPACALKARATRSVARTDHNPDDGVGTFSTVKWVLFRLTKTNRIPILLRRYPHVPKRCQKCDIGDRSPKTASLEIVFADRWISFQICS